MESYKQGGRVVEVGRGGGKVKGGGLVLISLSTSAFSGIHMLQCHAIQLICGFMEHSKFSSFAVIFTFFVEMAGI